MHALSDKLYESKSNFSILNLNAQSINAKFDEFQIAINEINNKHEVSIICIQESWLSSDSDTSLFDIPNYQLVAKGKYCSNHGGLLTYVHKDFYWENIAINDETTVWENLFIKVRHKTPGSKTQIVVTFTAGQMRYFMIFACSKKNSLKHWKILTETQFTYVVTLT